jgi:site-specific DNA recombinase
MTNEQLRTSRKMIHAAIYARKSTEQRVADEAKSVTRQVTNAKAFALTKGWTVAKEHIYVDDGISGAEFAKRPGLQSLMAALHPRPPFAVLIVSEQKSIGRETFETNYTIKQLAEAGVEVVEYMHGKSLTPKNAMDKVTGTLQSFSDEKAREDSSERVTEAHTRLHAAGRVTGGRVFGYRNVDVFNGVDAHGRPLRSHVEREKDPKEEKVVLKIFKLYDCGFGLKSICKQLNREGAPAPKPFQTNDDKEQGIPVTSGWYPSTVRGVLTRELYHGVAVWGRTKKKNAWGKLDPHTRPESEWHYTDVPHLRIIPEPLWQRVQARRKEMEDRATRLNSGRLCGRPPKENVQNLLAGLATCGICGRGLVVEHSNNAKGKYSYYMCHGRRHDSDQCTNTLRIRVAAMNSAILESIEQHALTPEAMEQVITLTERDDARGNQMALVRERKDIDKRIARFVTAVETAGDITAFAVKLRELEARRAAINTELSNLQPLPRLPKTVVQDRLAEWRRLLRQSTTQGRSVLQRVLRGRIVFTPDDAGGYVFEAPTRYDKLFSGIAVERPKFIPEGNRGAEHIGPEDTFDGDYGRLLEKATARLAVPTGNGVCARQVSNLRPPA